MSVEKRTLKKSAIDGRKLLRTIRIQGALIILLLIALALAGFWIWTQREEQTPTINEAIEGLRPGVRITMPVVVYGDGRQLNAEDTVHDPEVTVYGKIENFPVLRESLHDFTVLLQGTTVVMKRESGEFAERLILSPGQNIVDIVLKWGGVEQKRLQYQLDYQPKTPAETTTLINDF